MFFYTLFLFVVFVIAKKIEFIIFVDYHAKHAWQLSWGWTLAPCSFSYNVLWIGIRWVVSVCHSCTMWVNMQMLYSDLYTFQMLEMTVWQCANGPQHVACDNLDSLNLQILWSGLQSHDNILDHSGHYNPSKNQ